MKPTTPMHADDYPGYREKQYGIPTEHGWGGSWYHPCEPLLRRDPAPSLTNQWMQRCPLVRLRAAICRLKYRKNATLCTQVGVSAQGCGKTAGSHDLTRKPHRGQSLRTWARVRLRPPAARLGDTSKSILRHKHAVPAGPFFTGSTTGIRPRVVRCS